MLLVFYQWFIGRKCTTNIARSSSNRNNGYQQYFPLFLVKEAHSPWATFYYRSHCTQHKIYSKLLANLSNLCATRRWLLFSYTLISDSIVLSMTSFFWSVDATSFTSSSVLLVSPRDEHKSLIQTSRNDDFCKKIKNICYYQFHIIIAYTSDLVISKQKQQVYNDKIRFMTN